MENTADVFALLNRFVGQELHLVANQEIGLEAIVAIHSTKLGPALGGCRLVSYPNSSMAIEDALRLAQGMSYKAALADLPLGGGKTVILKPGLNYQRAALLQEVGKFVHSMHGKYIISVDSGTNSKDMDVIAAVTPYVIGSTNSLYSIYDPSIFTARGVWQAIKAAIKCQLKQDSLQGIRVLVQGLGNTGYKLCALLHASGAKLYVYDLNHRLMQQAVSEFQATAVSSLKELLAQPAEVFAPCALGGIINEQNLNLLKVAIIAGSANNQLANDNMAQLLLEHNITYVPDYVANVGGLIFVSAQRQHLTEEIANAQVDAIYARVIKLLQQANTHNTSLHFIAEQMVKAKLGLQEITTYAMES